MIKKIGIIATAILGLFQPNVFAQHHIINVVDKKTQQPVPYVNVCFEAIDKSHSQYTITDKNGQAANTCKKPCVVAISYMGYKTLIDTLYPETSRVFELVDDVFNLNQVVITATRTPKSLKNAPVITQIITSNDISNRGIRNVKEVLAEDIPGLEFQRGGFGADIKMQGLEAKNILILIDGERLAGENGNNIDYSRLSADNIERVEIVKGAASALYGSQAMGGVINIITKNSRKKFEASVSTQWTQLNEDNYTNVDPDDPKRIYKDKLDLKNLNINASIGFNFTGISGRTDFSAKSFDAYQLYDKKGITKEFVDIDTTIYNDLNPFPTGMNGYNDYMVQQKFRIPVNKRLHVELKGSYYNHNEYDFVPDNVFQKYIDYTYGGRLVYKLSDKYSITASYNHDTYRKFDYFEKIGEKELNYQNTFNNPKITGVASVGKKQQFTGGVELLSDALLSDKFSQSSLDEKSNYTSVIFLQDDIKLTDSWGVIAGVRGDFHSEFGSHFSPKLSAMHRYKKWIFRANYANGFRSPSLKELYMEWPIAWFTIKGDKGLKPETNNYVSASAEFTKSFVNTSATVYYNRLQNKIDGVWQNGQTVYQYVNVSRAELSGFELLAKIKFLKHFMFSGAYSFLHDKRPQGDLVSSASPHSGNIKLAYRYLRGKYEANFNLTSVIIGEKNYFVSETIEYRGEQVEGTYPVHFDAYSIWKLTVSQKYMNSFTLTAGIDNLFDYTADVVSFNTSTTPGRKFFVSLKVDIDKIVK